MIRLSSSQHRSATASRGSRVDLGTSTTALIAILLALCLGSARGGTDDVNSRPPGGDASAVVDPFEAAGSYWRGDLAERPLVVDDAIISSPPGGGDRRRVQEAGCADSLDDFEYATNKGGNVDANCNGIANTRAKNAKKRAKKIAKKCARLLSGGSESSCNTVGGSQRRRTVMDACPVTCGSCDAACVADDSSADTVRKASSTTTTTTSSMITTEEQTQTQTTVEGQSPTSTEMTPTVPTSTEMTKATTITEPTSTEMTKATTTATTTTLLPTTTEKDSSSQTGGNDGADTGGQKESSSSGELFVTPPPQRDYVFGEHVVERVDSVASCPTPDDYDPDTSVMLAVTNREIYIACHSWEEKFHPRFRTVIIVEERVADEWGLDELVRDVPCSLSLGATLMKLDNFGGELQGRKLALDLIEEERPETQFLMQCNCDIHAIPEWHNYYRPLGESVLKSARDFHLTRVQREPDNYSTNEEIPKLNELNFVQNVKDSVCWHRPILGMSFILVEDFADKDDLVTKFHGVDGCRWQKKLGPLARPDDYPERFPWLCSGNKWENHALMFDVQKLRTIRDVYIDKPVSMGVQTYPSDTKFGPRFAKAYGMCMVTHRDVHYHQDFAIEHPMTGEHTLDKYDDHVDKDTIRVLSLSSLCQTRNPVNPYYIFQAYNMIGLPPFIGGCGLRFYSRHVQSMESPWIPRDVVGKSLATDPLAVTLLSGKMEVFGWEPFYEGCPPVTLCYRIVGVLPGATYIFATEEEMDCSDCWEFMQIGTGTPGSDDGDTIRLTAVADVTMEEIRKMHPLERTLQIPSDGYIKNFAGPSEIKGKNHITNKGVHRSGSSSAVCGAPDQDEDRACGYLDSPEFDIPYSN